MIDIKTGQVTSEIPDYAEVESGAPESNFVTVELPRSVQSDELLTFLSNWIPLPFSLLTNEMHSTLQIEDAKSGWKSGVLPREEYIIASGTLFLSPGRQTLVTESNWSSPVIRVWDLTAPKPWWKLIAWSLVVPICILIWQSRLAFFSPWLRT